MSNDEVEIVGEGSAQLFRAGPMLCQMCNTDIEKFTYIQRDQHYNGHLNSSLISSTHQPKRTIRKDLFKPPSISKPQRRKLDDEFWYSALSRPPPGNCSPGLITLLKNALKKSLIKGNTSRAVLCWEAATHISNEAFDRRWGCGYRNFLMACAVLMSQQIQNIYFALLDDPFPPGVRNLQRWIEAAWKEGYDPEGAKDLENCLVGTQKWIGTGELYAAFTSRGIPSQLVDFDFSTSERGVQILVDWVVNYFSPQSSTNQSTVNDILRSASPVIATDKMPLILQYSGHSQTIVGYEISKKGDTNLLIFDPSKPPRSTMRRAAMAGSSSVVWEQSRTNQVLHSVMHPSSNGVASMLKRPSSALDLKHHKRTKSSESDDEVIVIEDSDNSCKNSQITSVSSGKVQSFTLDPADVVNHFRLSISKLRRKQDYQILYFPMTDPWSIEQRKRRKVVTSISGHD